MAESTTRKKYASDITDEQWAIIEPIVTGSHREERRGRERTVSLREIVNTIFYINRTGCQEHSIRLFREVARRRYLGKNTDCFTRADSCSSWA